MAATRENMTPDPSRSIQALALSKALTTRLAQLVGDSPRILRKNPPQQ